MWTAVLYDADQQGYPYLKRFMLEGSKRKQNYIGENKDSRLVCLTDEPYPRFRLTFGGNDAYRDPMEVDAEEFIAVKGFKAKGKRLTTWTVDSIEQLEPLKRPEDDAEDGGGDDEEQPGTPEDENLDPDAGKSQQQVIDEITGQLNLFGDEEQQ